VMAVQIVVMSCSIADNYHLLRESHFSVVRTVYRVRYVVKLERINCSERPIKIYLATHHPIILDNDIQY
jgi:hypothetical protein